MNQKQVVVIGGGPSGMIAAIEAAGSGCRVTLIDKNEKLGKKLYITGKGRCNLTNACDTIDIFPNIVTNPKFLYSSIYGFDNQQVMAYFEKLGLPLKVERGNRVFPVSDHSSDVIRVLQQELKRRKVQVELHSEVQSLMYEEISGKNPSEDSAGRSEVQGRRRISGVRLKNGKILSCTAVILATGGLSYPSTGSDGAGYRMAESGGHTIQKCHPALVPFVTEEDWCRELMGLTLKNVAVRLICGKKCLYEGFGELLFTHFGISGPLVLSASSYMGKHYGEPMTLILDLKPALSEEQLDERMKRDFTRYQNRKLIHALDDLLPKKLIPYIIMTSGLKEDQIVNRITRQERITLVQTFKQVPLHILKTRDYNEAIITSGGVNVKEVNPQTMESKLVSGLYFAGEILDVDAVTGGFNLQIAWSTGYAAGQAVSNA